jgi:hypothetical protein
MQTFGKSDPQFGPLLGFFTKDERTVTEQGLFGDVGFQYGTGGLHGCTMLTVVSNRAVYMVRSMNQQRVKHLSLIDTRH